VAGHVVTRKTVLMALAAAIVGCSIDATPKNGQQLCSTGGRACTSGYYCAADGKCWKEGSGPGNAINVDAALVDRVDATVLDGFVGDSPDGSTTELEKPDSSGLRNLANGESCVGADDCVSGSCTNRICCSSQCEGACMACDVPGKLGTCSPVPAGATPSRSSDCTRTAVATCGLDGTCDGLGACRNHPDGTVCVAGACSATTASVVGIKKCQAGQCVAGGSEVCTPFGCDSANNQCFGSCANDGQCAATQSCKGGSCGLKIQGARCAKADECESGYCVEGVCCAQACDGPCQICDSVGAKGECVFVSEGRADPRGMCRDEGVSTCGKSGVCNGKGACALYGVGTSCSSPMCSGNSAVPASTCDGNGTCVQGSPISCGSFKCVSGVCPGNCAISTDCVSPNACTAGSCGLKEQGQSCGGNSECKSAVCADGVCCDKGCSGACQACNLAASVGKCTSVNSGASDPHGICTGERKDASTCAENGLCDGSGGCQKYASGTVCSPESCSSDRATAASTCDGAGKCSGPAAVMCSPYKCNGDRCGQSCSSDNDCISPNTCLNGSCGPKPQGSNCSSANQCQSGFCAQGVCCDNACSGVQCKACNLQGSRGTCAFVSQGTIDPAGKCVNSNTICGPNGTCNANGSCRLGSSGTQCAAPECASATSVTAASLCDGAGSCSTPAPQACGGGLYTCSSGACRTSCSSDNDCAGGNFCSAGACSPKRANGIEAGTGSQCQSGFAVDGVCCASASCAGASCPSGSPNYSPAQKCNNPSSLGTCSAAPMMCGGPGVCGSNNACKVYARFDVSMYDDGNSVYGP